MTDLQIKMMNKLAHSEYTSVNGAKPESADETTTWAFDVIESKADGGVFTSLQKLGYVWFQKDTDEDMAGMTDEGFAVWKSTNE